MTFFFVGTNKTFRYIPVSALSWCPKTHDRKGFYCTENKSSYWSKRDLNSAGASDYKSGYAASDCVDQFSFDSP